MDNEARPRNTLAAIQQMIVPIFPGLLGLEIVEADLQRVVGRMQVRPELGTIGGVLHGGALMAFADTLGAIGTLLNLPEGGRTLTIESSTKFIGTAPVGSTVIGESTPFHRGRTTMVWQTVVRTDAGKLCGVITQTQMVLTG
jgi:uncharacterized protein (TIGR00369 family)